MEKKQMKSNICVLKKGSSRLDAVLKVTENSSEYIGLNRKQSLQLRLLAEELVGMLPALLELCEGEFWVEKDEEFVELHVAASVAGLDAEGKEKILSLSSSGKNSSKGVMGKIRNAAESLLSHLLSPSAAVQMPLSGADVYYSDNTMQNYVWSLNKYKDAQKVKMDENAWDELEKSIVANLADDVVVGIAGNKVEIVVKKVF